MNSVKVLIGKETSDFIDIEVVRYTYPVSDDHDMDWLSSDIRVSIGAWSGKKFHANLRSEDFVSFLTELKSLDNSLKGEANFSTLEEQILIKLKGNGKGSVEVEGVAISSRSPYAELRFNFEIDQTYLPKIINEVGQVIANFPIKMIKKS